MHLSLFIGVFLTFGLLPVGAAHAEGACPNEALRTGASAHLPDCRAYELVSPAYSEGFTVGVSGFSQDGSVLAQSFGSFSEVENPSSFQQQYELVRTATGWMANPLDVPFSQFASYNTVGISPHLDIALATAGTRAQGFEKGLYLRSTDGSLASVGPTESPTEGGIRLKPVSASEDLHRALFVIPTPSIDAEEGTSLWPGDRTAAGNLKSLYEYDYAGSEAKEPTLVGISNVGDPASVGGGHLISDCGTYPGSYPAGDVYNALSVSGDVAFFTSAALTSSCESGGGTVGPAVNEVYARFRGVPGSSAHTVAISEPSKTDCAACQTFEGEPEKRSPAVFDGASEDGSKVLFTSEQPLLPGAVGKGPHLYEYDFDAPEGARVTLLSSGDPEGARVLGVARVSEDGSHVYFVAEGQLTGPNAEGNAPAPGQPNLYVSLTICADSQTVCANPVRETRFVATLANADEGDWSVQDERPVQATPDGRFLAFQSTADLTPDQHGFGTEAGQVFEYDADTQSLVRVSRSQGGFNNDGNSREYSANVTTQTYDNREQPLGSGRFSSLSMSADGSRVFFATSDGLTPHALAGVPSVYEYHDGQVSLISDGYDTVSTTGHPAVEFEGTDESGQDVFFTSADSLVPQDTNDQVVLYDARQYGGFAPPAAAAPCSADACQGAPTAPPQSPPTPGSATLKGIGNLPPPTSTGATITPTSRAQKLKTALNGCRTGHPKSRRIACERQARRRYGAHRASLDAALHKGGK